MEYVKNLIDERAQLQSMTVGGGKFKDRFRQQREGKPALQPHRNQSVVRQSTAFKSERPRISKPRFASQVDVNNDLSKQFTTHYLLRKRICVAKPQPTYAPGSLGLAQIDMVHNHYLEEAKKKNTVETRVNFSRQLVLSDSYWKIFTLAQLRLSVNHNGSNDDITNHMNATKFLMSVQSGTRNARPQQCSSLVQAGSKSCSSSRQDSYITTRVRNYYFTSPLTMLRSYALSWKPCQGDSLNLPDHRIHKDGDGDPLFQLESNSLPRAHSQTTKTYYKH
ncbi:hypothetical protein Tco_0356869 [Tanacetum coccineum]